MTEKALLPQGERLYPARDHYALSPHFERHMLALTAEGLMSKSDIAAELAFRDQQIEELCKALVDSRELASGEF